MMKDLKTLLTCVHDFYTIKYQKEDTRRIIDLTESLDYSFSSQMMCWAQPNGGQATHFTKCRDYLNDSYLGFLHEYSTSYYKLAEKRVVGFDKLRLLFTGMNKERLEGAVHAINVYSKLAGWEPAECIHGRMQSSHGKWINVYLLEADCGWMRYPQIVSALLLFIRVLQGWAHITGLPDYIEDAYSLQGFWDEAIEAVRKSEGRSSGDISYLESCNPYMITLLNHEKEIFPEELPKAWQRKTKFHNNSGIYSFINSDCTSTHKKESEKLTEIYQSEVKRYEGH